MWGLEQPTVPTPSPLQRLRVSLPLVLAGIAGGAFAGWRFGWGVLNPARTDWFRGDSAWHFLTWQFFRNEPLHVPPGRIESFLYPLGTSIGGGDALPLLAFPFKAVSGWLPPEFQYLGLWLFVSYVLQGVFGYLLVRVFCPQRWLALPAALLFLLSPVMIFRAGHVALASHWLLLLALWTFFQTRQNPRFRPRRYALRWSAVVGLAGLVHPYLAAMVLPLAALSVVHELWHRQRLGLKTALALAVGLPALLGLEWCLSGLLGLGRGGGFDLYTLHPSALFNPQGRSRFLPSFPVGPGQYEGFGYLGLGILALGVLALALLGEPFIRLPRATLQRLFSRLEHRNLVPLTLFCLGLTLFALGNTALFILEVVFFYVLLVVFILRSPRLKRFALPPWRRARAFLLVISGLALAAFIPLVTSTFRAPGRFIWPVVYLLVLALAVFVLRRFSARTATILLLAALTLQAADLRVNRPFRPDPELFTRTVNDPRWPGLIRPFTTLAVVPPFRLSVGGPNDYREFAYLAATNGKRVTTGVLVRIPERLERVRETLMTEALEGPRDPRTLYIFSAKDFTGRFRDRLEPGLTCTRLDTYAACSVLGR